MLPQVIQVQIHGRAAAAVQLDAPDARHWQRCGPELVVCVRVIWGPRLVVHAPPQYLQLLFPIEDFPEWPVIAEHVTQGRARAHTATDVDCAQTTR